jgi:hypothetical protein
MSAAVMKPSTPSKAPSTPLAQSTPSTPQTGTWQHPRFNEIARRQNASTFTDRNVRSVIYNGSSLFGCWVAEKLIASKYGNPSFHSSTYSYDQLLNCGVPDSHFLQIPLQASIHTRNTSTTSSASSSS